MQVCGIIMFESAEAEGRGRQHSLWVVRWVGFPAKPSQTCFGFTYGGMHPAQRWGGQANDDVLAS